MPLFATTKKELKCDEGKCAEVYEENFDQLQNFPADFFSQMIIMMIIFEFSLALSIKLLLSHLFAIHSYDYFWQMGSFPSSFINSVYTTPNKLTPTERVNEKANNIILLHYKTINHFNTIVSQTINCSQWPYKANSNERNSVPLYTSEESSSSTLARRRDTQFLLRLLFRFKHLNVFSLENFLYFLSNCHNFPEIYRVVISSHDHHFLS